MFIQKEISDRIQMLRFLMIVGVVMLHVPQYVPLSDMGNGWFDFIKALFQHALFRATVPVLTLISGYLLFSTKRYQTPLQLWKRKLGSLVVPFLVFNLSVLFFAYLAQITLGVKMSYDLLAADTRAWLNATFGLTESPINYPLNFLRDMIVLVILAPAFGVLLRHVPRIGFALVILFFYTNQDGPLLLRDTMPILFYAGGLIAIKKWDVRVLDKYAKWMFAGFLAMCICMVALKIADRTLFVLAAPVFIWSAASLLVHTRPGRWAVKYSRYSFFIFIAHAPLLMLSWLVYQKLSGYIAYPLYWTATPVVVVAALVLTYELAMTVAPKAFALAIGKRTSAATALVERRKVPRAADAPVYSQEMRRRLAHGANMARA